MSSRIGNFLVLGALIALAVFFGSLQTNFPVADAGPRGWAAIGILVIYLLASVGWFAGQRRLHRHAAVRPEDVSEDTILVTYASQTGFAQEIAERTASQLKGVGAATQLIGMDFLTPVLLAQFRHSLWIVSTTGEGDPPDMSMPFLNAAADVTLRDHQYALLALGDRTYDAYCGFGRQMEQWLSERGAQAVQPMIEVDNADKTALRAWQTGLRRFGDVAHWDAPSLAPFAAWTLQERKILNPGSLGWPTVWLKLAPPPKSASWQAGDIAQVAALVDEALPPDDMSSAEWREYSIASIPADGGMELLVRLTQRDDGSYGLISGLLCKGLEIGDRVALRVRSNPSFHSPADSRPLILIGNGTGIAGLRSVLKERIGDGFHRNWLVFGERQRYRDFYFHEELRRWETEGKLERLDAAFSRDPSPSYVFHELERHAAALREWIGAGASIYVCGSRDTMGKDVDRTLRSVLGSDPVDELLRQDRYRRDVY